MFNGMRPGNVLRVFLSVVAVVLVTCNHSFLGLLSYILALTIGFIFESRSWFSFAEAMAYMFMATLLICRDHLLERLTFWLLPYINKMGWMAVLVALISIICNFGRTAIGNNKKI